MDAFSWLLSPALIAGLTLAVLPLYDPSIRWSRRLRNDIQIGAGLPDGDEKRRMESSIVLQATRLREYREVFVGRHLVGKWFSLAYIAVTVAMGVVWPPISKPGDKYPLGPTDYSIVVIGTFLFLYILINLAVGNDFQARSPKELKRSDRVIRYERRLKKLQRIDKERSRRATGNSPIRTTGSRLGFHSQVDEFAVWVSSWEMRSIAKRSGWIAAGLDDRARKSLHQQGISVPTRP